MSPDNRRNKRKRPRIPEAPASLVRLIQSDPAVLTYMQALQANLEHDVYVWKQRAMQNARLNPQQEQLQAATAKKKKKKKKTLAKEKTATATAKQKRNKTSPQPRINEQQSDDNEQEETGEEINDDMFDILSSSSSSSSDEEKEETNKDGAAEESKQKKSVATTTTKRKNRSAKKPAPTKTTTVAVPEKQACESLNKMRSMLTDARKTMEYIGAPLVVREASADHGNTDETVTKDESLPPAPLATVQYKRRSDIQVITDIFYQIHVWSRLEHAFDPVTLLPQPVVQQAMQQLFRSLVILDSFDDSDCQHLFQETPDDDSSDKDSSQQQQRVGCCLPSRKQMVQQLLDTLSAEISETWAMHGRSTQRTTVGLHFDAHAADGMDKTLEETTNQGQVVLGQKTLARLATIFKMRLLAELTIGLHLSRNDYESASQVVFQYLVSTMPTRAEDYPKLPPVQSLVVLEAMFYPTTVCWWMQTAAQEQGHDNWFQSASKDVEVVNEFFGRVVAACLTRTAEIYKERLRSVDSRIRRVAQVEWDCFQRLVQSESAWLPFHETASNLLEESFTRCIPMEDNFVVMKAHLLNQLLYKDVREAQKSLVKLLSQPYESSLFQRVKPMTETLRQHVTRNVDAYIVHCRDIADVISMFDLAESMMSFMKQSIETNIGKTLIIASTLLEGTVALANGRATELLMAFIIFSEHLSREKFEIVAVNEWELLRFYLSVREAADTPNICIINLRRRTDRKNSILAQAMKEKLMVRLAVASLHPESKPSDDSYHGGCYAFDGSGRMVDAHRQLLADIGGTSVLNSLVHVQWRPNDLKPFDRDAPSDESLVRMSETEVACALSHIASWKGALRSLQLDNHQNADKNRTPNNLFDYPLHTLRSLRIGGFARGPALLYQNTHMSPAPVMIILEDDAILVDRFRERLDELLEELPQDFHFCSIGFSRPKSAPIVPYGKHCGVPTHVFYLTGYLLSAAGAEYLLNQLPVVGPVDSFIGLKMTSNWANVFGEHVGVGIQSKPIADPVAKKDMARILSFRAFCALEPLCSQRVGTVTAAAASVTGRGLAGRAWRQRDTDVQYSGDRRGSFRKERPSR